MIAKYLTPALLTLALVSCASQRKDPYDTGNLYGYPDAAYGNDDKSLYDTPPAYQDDAGKPDLEPAEPAAASYRSHTVVRGDTLSKISHKYNVKMSSIIKANNIKNKNLLVIGQKLIIPSH